MVDSCAAALLILRRKMIILLQIFGFAYKAIIEGNDDLLIEILLFLPAKSLVSFKTVSKRWRSLISDPIFCHRHTLHHPRRRRETQTLLLGCHESEYLVCNPTVPKLYPLSQLHFGIPSAKVLQSCNGLLLLQTHKKEGCCYYVFNPTTMQRRELPPSPCKSFVGLFLMLDPYLSPHYVVVCFANPTRKGTLIYLYKSEKREWEVAGEAIKMGVRCGSGFYFNGGICFPRFSSSCLFTPDCNHTKFPNIPQYQSRGREQKSCVLESNGVMWSLTLSWDKQGCCNVLLVVFEMKEEEEGRWRKKRELDMNPIMAKCGGGDCGGIRFVSMVRAEKEEDCVLMFFLRGKFRVYRFCDGVVEDIDDWCWGNVHHFIHTLAPA